MKPVWVNKVPWCSKECPQARPDDSSGRLFPCLVKDGIGTTLTNENEVCLPAVRKLAEAALDDSELEE